MWCKDFDDNNVYWDNFISVLEVVKLTSFVYFVCSCNRKLMLVIYIISGVEVTYVAKTDMVEESASCEEM